MRRTRSAAARTNRRSRTKHFAYVLIRLDVRSSDEIDAIGNRRKDAIERFLDRLRLSGKIDDQRPATDDSHLPRQDGSRNVFKADLPHVLAEAGQDLVRDSKRCLGSD